MITFTKKAAPQTAPDNGQENRFEQIRKTAKEKHLTSDADAARRRVSKTTEEDRLV
ncbi:MAG: hypothetical protein MEQ84_11240 [Mesorhizobium sp.]|nr:hypothetical protein [Mesorhizobium sp.]